MAPSKAEKAERDQILQALSTKLFCDILDDFVMDIALETHAEVSKSRAVCETCGTRCNAAHVPASSNQTSQVKPSPSQAETPSTAEGGASTPNGVKSDGTIHLECVNCSRTIASNRYAPHLSSCMGLNTSRRGAVRGSTKSKQPSDAGRSGSPASEAGYASEDKSPQKSKGKSKTKRTDEAEFNLKRKRPISPQVSPSKKQKQKGSPVSRVKSEVDGLPSGVSSLPSTNSQSKIPSKLRDSSTAPFNDSNSSRESSPDASLSSTLSSGFKNKGLASRSAPVKQPSPPRPPPLITTYIDHDEEGNETGSSTDDSA
ncbi:hypothetical protein GYMLUDRAFT_33441 [Collybiopsis luxurians FD-317 M1]|nr:hypothetical protein GYMLUDRAFT_33441 [Collybiopsis luxurians FD-317 M1]